MLISFSTMKRGRSLVNFFSLSEGGKWWSHSLLRNLIFLSVCRTLVFLSFTVWVRAETRSSSAIVTFHCFMQPNHSCFFHTTVRGEGKSTADIFFRNVKFWEGKQQDAPPIFVSPFWSFFAPIRSRCRTWTMSITSIFLGTGCISFSRARGTLLLALLWCYWIGLRKCLRTIAGYLLFVVRAMLILVFQVLDEDSIRTNFILIYELLDEMLVHIRLSSLHIWSSQFLHLGFRLHTRDFFRSPEGQLKILI